VADNYGGVHLDELWLLHLFVRLLFCLSLIVLQSLRLHIT
jgi:hypothetical protein